MASTPKLTTTISSFPSLQILCRKLPIAINLPSSSTSRSLPKTLSHLSSLHRPHIASVSNHRVRFEFIMSFQLKTKWVILIRGLGYFRIWALIPC
ncbi:hypothetical protein YC2023_039555 [Brassica napus]